MDTSISGSGLDRYPLLTALRERRSRRFGLGMKIPAGPLAYQSRHPAVPLTEAEEAALVFAGCGVTGHALADLCYAKGEGGNIMAGLAGRTVASGDGLQTVALVVINDSATWLIRRPREMPAGALPELIDLGRRGAFTELYRRTRVKLKEGRTTISSEPLFNINANRWSAHAPGTTCFLPVNDLTHMYINGLLEIFNESTGAFALDERNHFLPAGLGKFARSRGGHLEDNPQQGRVATVRQVEQFVTEFVTLEQGMMLQNLGLMTQALGLGGFPNFANHEFAWFQALDFRMAEMVASRYVGAGPVVSFAMNAMRRNPKIPYPVGLERNGEVLLKPFCPPYYPTMTDAVRAVVDLKFGTNGLFRGGAGNAWARPAEVTQQVPAVSEATVAAATAYCEYLWKRYGRFPVYMPPYRTVVAFQACHLDAEFYDCFYKPEVLGSNQHEDFGRCAK
ncbi:MAG TPA: hypothetical protein VN794_13100 [Methylomirabilota bacterium]|nr:hypothetical protein [Methylomirabilota bacterium]